MTRPTATPSDSKPALIPKLRFREFRDGPSWQECRVQDICELNPPHAGLPEKFFYIDLEAVERGRLKAKTLVSKIEAPSRAQRLLEIGDVIFQIVRPYQRNNLFFNLSDAHPFVASTGYAQLRALESESFLYHAIHTDQFVSQVIAQCTGSNYPAINSSDLAEIPLAKPSFAEQQKIADCLSTLDALIGAESQKLDALKAHKKGLMQQLFPRAGDVSPRLRFPEFRSAPDWDSRPLGGLCRIRTGKKDANEGAEDGEYPFFTCAEDHIYSHSYSFDAEAILIAGNANVGQTRYYNGKFEAYQRTYVLTDFSDIHVPYLFVLLSANLQPALLAQVQTSAMSYIRLPMLEEFQISVPPSKDEQHRIATCLTSLDDLIANQRDRLSALQSHKQGLLQQLFPSPAEVDV